jgi:ribosomal subunit interface protein
MQVPLEVTFRDMDKSEAVESHIRDYVARLERFCDHIDSCRVALEQPHKHAKHGHGYRVRIDLRIPPGNEVVITREPQEGGGVHDDLYKVVHDAFKAAERKVKKLTEQQRGEVKRHPEQQLEAVVVKLNDDHGFLESTHGETIYFHENSVLPPGFDALREGAGVAYEEEAGDEGPQASSVRLIDRRGH